MFPLGTIFGGLRVVRANPGNPLQDRIVANYDFTDTVYTIDNINSMMTLFWKDDQDNLFVGRFGTSGSYTTSNLMAINTAYPSSADSNVAAPIVTITDASGNAVSTATNYFPYKSTAAVTKDFWQMGPVTLPSSAIGGFSVTCGMEGRETIKLTIPAGTTVPAGSTAFVYCTNDQKIVLFQPTQATIVPSVVGQLAGSVDASNGLVPAASTGTPITTGFMQLTQYGDSACKVTSLTKYVQLGVCQQTGLDYSVVKSATVSGTVTTFFGTPYTSNNCNPTTMAPQGIEEDGVDTQTVKCQAQSESASYLSAFYTARIPATPSPGQLALYTYGSAATCATGTVNRCDDMIILRYTPSLSLSSDNDNFKVTSQDTPLLR